MPRSNFRPFPLSDAFTADVSGSIIPVTSEPIVVEPTSTPSTPSTPSTSSTSSTSEMKMMISHEEEPMMITSGCNCGRCSRKSVEVNVIVSNEDLDKKLNWILTLVVFMFIMLIIHIRSQKQ